MFEQEIVDFANFRKLETALINFSYDTKVNYFGRLACPTVQAGETAENK